MKIYAIVTGNYLPNLGGVERFSYNLAKNLIKKGHKAIIITSNVYNLASYEVLEDIVVYRLPCYNLLKGRFPVVKINREFFNLVRQIKKEKIQNMIVNTRFYLLSYLWIFLSKKWKISNLLLEHGTAHLTIGSGIWDFAGRCYEHFITKMIKMKCDGFYGVSNACCKWLSHFHIEAKGIIYNAIDIDNINQILSNPKKNFRDDYRIEKDGIVISFTGRLLEEKGVLKLIEAINKINRNIYLFIAGDGDLKDKILSMQSDRIICLGKIDFEEVICLLNSTDIYVLPTSYPEGFPTSVLEAIACKCYVITTEAGGSKELITDRDYGWILKNNSVEEIIESINYVIEHSEYRKEATKKAYEKLLHEFTWENTTKKVIEVTED